MQSTLFEVVNIYFGRINWKYWNTSNFFPNLADNVLCFSEKERNLQINLTGDKDAAKYVRKSPLRHLDHF